MYFESTAHLFLVSGLTLYPHNHGTVCLLLDKSILTSLLGEFSRIICVNCSAMVRLFISKSNKVEYVYIRHNAICTETPSFSPPIFRAVS